MQTTSNINLHHVIAELAATIEHRKSGYPKLVQKRKMTPYTRDHKIAVMEILLQCAVTARDTNTTLYQQIQKLPTNE